MKEEVTVPSRFDVTSLRQRRATNRWERVSVGDLLERVTWSWPDKEAIVALDGACADLAFERLTYRQANDLANQVAHGFLAQGLQDGDAVMLFCENSVEAYITKIAIAKAGLVCAPLNPMMAVDVIDAMIDLVEPKLAVVDAELWPLAQATFAARRLKVAFTVTIGGPPVDDSVSFTEFAQGRDTTEPDVTIHGDDIWELLFTSGTTAFPKGVMISHSSAHFGALNFALSLTRGLRIENELRLGTYLPMLYHVGDQVFSFATFLSAGTFFLGRRPDAAGLARAIDRERLTAVWAGSPAMVTAIDEELRDHPQLDSTSLRVMVFGWASLAPAVLKSLKSRCGHELVVFEVFGQTEAIACHRFWPDAWPDLYEQTAPAVNYVGVPSPILAATVMGADGDELSGKPGQPGDAVYRSPVMMAGYYRDPAATETAFRHGWFHSGDTCVYDKNGLRIMVDRSKDIVKSGGENVSSLRVESVLGLHPDVARCVVVGLPHEHWGEAVTAVVIPKPGAHAPATELIAYCRERLAGFETPKDVVFVDSLPETVGGKVLKYRLRENLEAHYNHTHS